MEDIINRIIEIDKNARERLEEANKKKSCILIQAEEDEEKVKLGLIERANARLAKVEEFEKANADEKIQKINLKTEEIIKTLENEFVVNHIAWENDIFNRVIKN